MALVHHAALKMENRTAPEFRPRRLPLSDCPARSVAPGNYSDDFAIFWMTHCPPALFKLPQNWAASSVDPNGPTMVR